MKKVKILVAFFFILFASAGIAHAYVFPQETRCILIDFYDFEKEDNLYFRAGLDQETKNNLKRIIQQAEVRVAEFWGEQRSHPKFIYCAQDEDYLKFGVPFMTPASAKMKLGAYVVISKNGIDLDIIAHELSHTELFERIGFFNRTFQIPTWFDEGLAMQVDHRAYYSIDSLKAKSNDFQNLPAVKEMDTFAQFGNGTRAQVMLHYATAKYELSKWYSPENLKQFIEQINEGVAFDAAYNNAEHKGEY